MGYALIAVSGIALALGLAVAYYRNRVKLEELRSGSWDVAQRESQDRAVAAELDRAARDAERYRQAQEKAKNATVSDAIVGWTAASERLRTGNKP